MGTGPATHDPVSAEAVFTPIDTAFLDPLLAAPRRVVADIGPGAGTVTLRLAEHADLVYAVDVDAHALTALERRAAAVGVGDRLRCVHHDLDDGPPPLPEPVELVWASACVSHALDRAAAVAGLAGLLTPGGVLALAEGGLPARCLPWEVGVGRPGLEVRLDAAHDAWSYAWHVGRAGFVAESRDWPELLRAAGLDRAASRSAVLDLPAPLDDQARAVTLDLLAARVGRAGRHLTPDDAAVWARLLDPADANWLGHRADLHLLTARTLHTGYA